MQAGAQVVGRGKAFGSFPFTAFSLQQTLCGKRARAENHQGESERKVFSGRAASAGAKASGLNETASEVALVDSVALSSACCLFGHEPECPLVCFPHTLLMKPLLTV